MSWSLAMDMQTTTVEFWRSHEGRRFGRAYLESLTQQYGPGGIDLGQPHPDSLSIMCEAMIGGAEPMYITGDVTLLIERARESFKPEPLIREDIMIPWGFAYFNRPSSALDVNGVEIPIRGLTWAPYVKRYLDTDNADDAVAVAIQMTDVLKGKRYASTKLVDNPEQATGLIFALYSSPDDYRFIYGDDGGMGRWPLGLFHWTKMPFDSTAVSQIHEVEQGDPKVMESATRFDTLIQVFFRLMQQRILVQHPEVPARPERRRSKRMGLNKDRVLVVKLRRPSNPRRSEGGSVDWTHRWMVGGHWHTYWCGSGEDRYSRQRWVDDYVKGPADKELIIKPRAFEFKR